MTLVFLTRFFYPHIGGVEKHVLEISKILIKKGHKVVVVTEELSKTEGDSSPRHHLAGLGMTGAIEIYRIPVGKNEWLKKFRIWAWLWKHRKIIAKADIVHCHDVFFWYFPFRFLYLNKPVYTTFHGYETKFPPSRKAILIRRISEKLSWGNICVGDYIKKWYGTKPDYVTHGGVDIESQKSKVKSQNYKSKLKIIFIGRLEADTGVPTYLKTLELLKESNMDFEFSVCGDGSLRKDAEGYGTVHGFVENISSYIGKAYIVFTSSYLSILQGMANKRLVFAVFDNPLKEDYLKMTPFAKWIVIENSSEKLASKIEYLMSHYEEKEKMIEAGYEWTNQHTWQKVVDFYIKLWHSSDKRCYD